MTDLHRRRRRSRRDPTTGDPEPTRDRRQRSRKDRRHPDPTTQAPPTTEPKTDPVPQPPRHPTTPPEPPQRAARDDDDSERGLRGLIGAGNSQVSPTAALRARDAARPTADDLATADRDLTLIRRHWSPH